MTSIAAVLAVVQGSASDLPRMLQVQWQWESSLLILGFVACLACMYLNTASFLQVTYYKFLIDCFCLCLLFIY
jgi:hypothetical protein